MMRRFASSDTRWTKRSAVVVVLVALATTPAFALDPDDDSEAAPPTEAPTTPPPAPPASLPEPPAPGASGVEVEPNEPPPSAAGEQVPLPDGQWVYTSQYGWVWMPYSETYTFVPKSGYPYAFMYYPQFGWRWQLAPWVFGWGRRPYWGARGPTHFAWYAHPWFMRRDMRGGSGWHGGGRGHWGGRMGGRRR